MSKTVQISAEVDPLTKMLMDRYVRATGIKQGRLIQEAIRRYIQEWEEVPPEFRIPTRIVLTRESGEMVLRAIREGKANQALKDLMRSGD